MTEQTHLQMIKADKQAHAQEILVSIDSLIDLLESRPELWFGGQPALFTNLKNQLGFTGGQISTTFEVEWDAPTT